MNTKIKYIRFRSGFILFPEQMKHTEIRYDDEPISAGFCYYDGTHESWFCYGESVSLNLKSKDDDSLQLCRQMIPYYQTR